MRSYKIRLALSPLRMRHQQANMRAREYGLPSVAELGKAINDALNSAIIQQWSK